MSKIIFLIGKTGSGKSTLANVISGTNKFVENESSSSVTKEIQKEEFLDKNNSIDYSVIDTVGIGDTQLKEEEVLDRIAEAVYLSKEGISQILFITGGRFDQFEMFIYNLLKTIIFDESVTNYTTIVRTRFSDFENKKACQKDIEKMLSEKELGNIINSCQNRVIHINNPAVEGKEGRELAMNIEEREESRKMLLNHLKNNCQSSDSYKPQKLQELSSEISDYMRIKMEAKGKLAEKELKKMKTEEKSAKETELLNKQSFDNVSEIELEEKKLLKRKVLAIYCLRRIKSRKKIITNKKYL
ncbi:MAG: GTPase Der [Mycoplasmataceae bacterium]|nr:MAG: GTPase Der [Mycoplasmataceae bacterium]